MSFLKYSCGELAPSIRPIDLYKGSHDGLLPSPEAIGIVTHQELLLRPIRALYTQTPHVSPRTSSASIGMATTHTIDILLVTSKVNGLDTTNLLLSNANGRTGSSSSSHKLSGSDVGALLNTGSGQLASCAQGLGETS